MKLQDMKLQDELDGLYGDLAEVSDVLWGEMDRLDADDIDLAGLAALANELHDIASTLDRAVRLAQQPPASVAVPTPSGEITADSC